MTASDVRVGIVGTSWWADAMYAPALQGRAAISAVCGRDRDRAEAFAARWGAPHVFTDHRDLIESGTCDALIVATPNDTHHPIAMAALEEGLHVLCEKPIGLDVREAAEMAAAARAAGAVTMVPFTYRYLPGTRFLRELIDDGFLGDAYHAAFRYYAGYARDGEYSWRLDAGRAGSGALGDLASHFIHLALWLIGPVVEVTAELASHVDRAPTDPRGRPYRAADDSAIVVLRFGNGAHGIVHGSAVASEETPYGQRHEIDLHGSSGTLRYVMDWDRLQQVTGARAGEGMSRILDIPDHIWGDARRDRVIDTYHDVFRRQGRMVGEFIEAVAGGSPVRPDFEDGLAVQFVLDAAVRSAAEGRRVALSELRR